MKKLILPIVIAFLFIGCKKKEEGNLFKNGSGLTLEGKTYSSIIIDDMEWTSVNYTGSFGVYYNKVQDNDNYGKLVSLYDIKEIQKLLSDGWRVPTIRDYVKLIDKFGGFVNPDASKKSDSDIIDEYLNESTVLKLISKSGWENTTAGNNQSGFNIFPAGTYRITNETFSSKGYYTYLWTSDIVQKQSGYYLPIALGISYDHEDNTFYSSLAEDPQALTNITDNSRVSGSLRFVRDIK